MENTRNKPAPRRLPWVAYIAFLLLAALAFTGTSVASFKTQSTSTDGARVARFVVTAAKDADQSESIKLDSTNRSAAYKFTVANNQDTVVSETAAKYDVVVAFPTALSGVTMTLTKDGASAPIAGITADNKTFTFSNAGSFSASTAQTDSFTLTFAADTSAPSGGWNNITITVNAAQVD